MTFDNYGSPRPRADYLRRKFAVLADVIAVVRAPRVVRQQA